MGPAVLGQLEGQGQLGISVTNDYVTWYSRQNNCPRIARRARTFGAATHGERE